MSLLLLFTGSGQAITFACWSPASTQGTSWTEGHYDFANVWSEWGTTTWGTIASSGLTWEGMAGFTFTVTSTTPTVWGQVSVATCAGV